MERGEKRRKEKKKKRDCATEGLIMGNSDPENYLLLPGGKLAPDFPSRERLGTSHAMKLSSGKSRCSFPSTFHLRSKVESGGLTFLFGFSFSFLSVSISFLSPPARSGVRAFLSRGLADVRSSQHPGLESPPGRDLHAHAQTHDRTRIEHMETESDSRPNVSPAQDRGKM